MRLLIDTNVVLDVLLARAPFCTPAEQVLNLSQRDDIEEYVSASTITDIYYIAHRQLKDRALTKDLIRRLISVVSVAAVTEKEIEAALNLPWSDFEDSVQYSVALLNDFDAIVTRDAVGYYDSKIRVISPEQILSELI